MFEWHLLSDFRNKDIVAIFKEFQIDRMAVNEIVTKILESNNFDPDSEELIDKTVLNSIRKQYMNELALFHIGMTIRMLRELNPKVTLDQILLPYGHKWINSFVIEIIWKEDFTQNPVNFSLTYHHHQISADAKEVGGVNHSKIENFDFSAEKENFFLTPDMFKTATSNLCTKLKTTTEGGDNKNSKSIRLPLISAGRAIIISMLEHLTKKSLLEIMQEWKTSEFKLLFNDEDALALAASGQVENDDSDARYASVMRTALKVLERAIRNSRHENYKSTEMKTSFDSKRLENAIRQLRFQSFEFWKLDIHEGQIENIKYSKKLPNDIQTTDLKSIPDSWNEIDLEHFDQLTRFDKDQHYNYVNIFTIRVIIVSLAAQYLKQIRESISNKEGLQMGNKKLKLGVEQGE